MPIKSLLQEIATQWPIYASNKITDKNARAHVLVAHELPTHLKGLLDATSNLELKGSTGNGNITASPWIGAFDPRLTTGATNGYYVVYLFSVDMRTVTLAIAFGTTQFESQFGAPRAAFPRMREAVSRLQGLFSGQVPAQYSREPINLQATPKQKLHFAYEQSSIFSLAPYKLAELPDEDILTTDFLETVRIYKAIVEDPLRPDVEQLLQSTIPDPGPLEDIEANTFEPRRANSNRGRGKKPATQRRYSAESRRVGDAGEKAVISYEKRKLLNLGLPELAAKIVHHAARGEFPGWDITSYDASGKEIYIEVKASIGKTISTVDITANEWSSAQNIHFKDQYHLYLVSEALCKRPRIEILKAPHQYVADRKLTLTPVVYQLDLHLASDDSQSISQVP